MGKKICLDSDVVIDAIKNHEYYVKLGYLFQNNELYITTITIFELYQRTSNLDVIEEMISHLKVLDFDTSSAILASTILKNLKKGGTTIPVRDLFIGSIAITNNCELLTNNIKDFKNIPNLKLVQV